MRLILEIAGHELVITLGRVSESDEQLGEHDNIGSSTEIAEPVRTEHDAWCFGFGGRSEHG